MLLLFCRLQELHLTQCLSMTDRDLLEGIGSLHGLTCLFLIDGWNLTTQALARFFHRPTMTSIEFLFLAECRNVDDEVLKVIAERCNK
jgi:hypothetical protein